MNKESKRLMTVNKFIEIINKGDINEINRYTENFSFINIVITDEVRKLLHILSSSTDEIISLVAKKYKQTLGVKLLSYALETRNIRAINICIYCGVNSPQYEDAITYFNDYDIVLLVENSYPIDENIFKKLVYNKKLLAVSYILSKYPIFEKFLCHTLEEIDLNVLSREYGSNLYLLIAKCGYNISDNLKIKMLSFDVKSFYDMMKYYPKYLTPTLFDKIYKMKDTTKEYNAIVLFWYHPSIIMSEAFINFFIDNEYSDNFFQFLTGILELPKIKYSNVSINKWHVRIGMKYEIGGIKFLSLVTNGAINIELLKEGISKAPNTLENCGRLMKINTYLYNNYNISFINQI